MNYAPGSYGGDATRLTDDMALECKICWWVYDPELGDDDGQIPPGTPFAQLPESWACPNCDGSKADFLVIPK